MKLNYREFGDEGPVLIILHGLLGASQNWQRVAKTLSREYRILVPDQRNHGDSPHDDEHSYEALREDILNFAEQHKLERFHLLGHSMGGIAAMEFAFHYPEYLDKLIIEDIAPRSYDGSSLEILQALHRIEMSQFDSREDIDRALAGEIPDKMTRQFLLTNLTRTGQETFRWRVNLSALLDFQKNMGEYEVPLNARYDGETLFVGGANSPYRIEQDAGLVTSYFSAGRIVTVADAGHWIHFEKADEFVNIVREFLAG